MKRGLRAVATSVVILLIGVVLALNGVTTLNLSTTDPDEYYVTERTGVAAGSGEDIIMRGKVLTTAGAVLVLSFMMALMLADADPARDNISFQDYYIHSAAGGLLAATIMWLKFLFLDGGIDATFQPGEMPSAPYSMLFQEQAMGRSPLLNSTAAYAPPILSLVLFLVLFVVFAFVIHAMFRRNEPFDSGNGQ